MMISSGSVVLRHGTATVAPCYAGSKAASRPAATALLIDSSSVASARYQLALPAGCPCLAHGPAVAPTPQKLHKKRRNLHTCATSSGSSGISLFPSGSKQASVTLPAVLIQLKADQFMASPDSLDKISKAVRAGATGVVLSEGAPGTGASSLYEAAVKLKGVLAQRAALLIVDRMDIAQAVDADGVLLTDTGVPTVVAKRMLAATGGGLVGRIVNNATSAVEAAADGANLVVVTSLDQGPPDAATLIAARKQQRSGSAIPVLMAASSMTVELGKRLAAAWPLDLTANTPTSRCDGLALDLSLFPMAASVAQTGTDSAASRFSVDDAVSLIAQQLKAGGTQAGKGGSSSVAAKPAPAAAPRAAVAAPAKPAGTGSRVGSLSSTWARRLSEGSESAALLADEKQVLAGVLEFLEEVVPQLAELSLLRDAVKQLDEPFLVVVVGEFNSGKSSVINALLGKKFLAEGILPTTNEISVLRFSDEPGAEKQVQQQADGLYVRYLPAPLLQEMQIVDTPGTNVILERQQRLTEEYVPRADLVLFVMSADRPFSESEVRFLEYIRQWRKKVVFVVNKADMLDSQDEVDQVKSFVADNARRLLKLDDPPVIAVSSRAAIKAKQGAIRKTRGSVVDEVDGSLLAGNPEWRNSGFAGFERLVYAFLIGDQAASAGGGGGVEGAGEGVRLKLQTPLYVADALVGAAGRKLGAELTNAQAELNAVRAISQQLDKFRAEMDKDAAAQRDALLKVLASVTSRMDGYIDRTLALSNAVRLVDYMGGSKGTVTILAKDLDKFEAEAVGGTFDRVRDAVAEHSVWLDANCDAQLAYYRSFVDTRVAEARAAGRDVEEVAAALAALPYKSSLSTTDLPASAASASSSADSSSSSPDGQAIATTSSTSTTALVHPGDFDLQAAARLLDEELREAVMGTATTAVGAPALGLIVTSWIENGFEDLLVLGVAGAAAYASVLNLPLRRAEIKGKVAKLASKFVEGVQERMAAQLEQQLGQTIAQIERLVIPLEQAADAEVLRLEELEARREELADELQQLGQRAANLI